MGAFLAFGFALFTVFIIAFVLSLASVTLAWIFVGIITVIITCSIVWDTNNCNKKLRDINKSDVVFIESNSLYAILLEASSSEVVCLHTTFNNSGKPSFRFSETKHRLSDVFAIVDTPKDPAFYSINQIASIAKDLYLNIDPQEENLESQLIELRRLEKLAESSRLYRKQADLYSRAIDQVQSLLIVSQNLSSECTVFILDVLIGQELSKYNTDNLPDIFAVKMSLNNRFDRLSSQYNLLMCEMEEYMNLKNDN